MRENFPYWFIIRKKEYFSLSLPFYEPGNPHYVYKYTLDIMAEMLLAVQHNSHHKREKHKEIYLRTTKRSTISHTYTEDDTMQQYLHTHISASTDMNVYYSDHDTWTLTITDNEFGEHDLAFPAEELVRLYYLLKNWYAGVPVSTIPVPVENKAA